MRGPRGGGADGGGVGSGVAFGSSRGVLRVRFGRGVAFDDSSASHSSNHSTRGALRCGKMSASERRQILTAELLSIGSELTVGETRDTNAGELARSLTGLGVRVTRITALPDDLDQVTDAFATGLARADLVVSTGGLGPDPRRPDARGDRRGDRRDAAHRPGSRGLAARAVGPARHALPRAEPQAGLADPVGRRPAEPERDRAGLVRRTAGRPRGRRPARPAARDAPDVERSRRAAPAGARSRGRGRLADVPARGDRRIAGRRAARRDDPAGDQPDRRHLRARRGGRCPGLGRRRRRAGRPRSSWRTPRPSSSTISATTSGPPARPPGARRSVRVSTSLDGRWRWSRSGPAAASMRCSATRRGSASTNRSRPTHPRPRRTGPTTSRRTRAGRASSAVPMSGSPSGRDRGPGIPPSRSRSSRRSGERRVRRLVFLTGPMGRSRAALAATAVLLETLRD